MEVCSLASTKEKEPYCTYQSLREAVIVDCKVLSVPVHYSVTFK